MTMVMRFVMIFPGIMKGTIKKGFKMATPLALMAMATSISATVSGFWHLLPSS